MILGTANGSVIQQEWDLGIRGSGSARGKLRGKLEQGGHRKGKLGRHVLCVLASNCGPCRHIRRATQQKGKRSQGAWGSLVSTGGPPGSASLEGLGFQSLTVRSMQVAHHGMGSQLKEGTCRVQMFKYLSWN